MSLNQFFQDVGTELQEFLWRDAPEKTRQAEVGQLEERARQGAATLKRRRVAIDELRGSIDRKEQRVSRLASCVEVYLHVGDQATAWQRALELDQVRSQLLVQRAQLQLLRGAYHQQKAHLQALQQQLADLHGCAY